MGSGNHWPNLFKVNPSPLQRQISTSPTMSTEKASAGEGTSSPGATHENTRVKQRWNALPEQKNILEDLFKSGMQSPDLENIRRITCLLQAYGHVEESNVFYWFQNRKSREKRKQQLNSESRSAPTSAGEVSPPPMLPPQQMNAIGCDRCRNALITVPAIMNDSNIVHTESGDGNQNAFALIVFINGIPFDVPIWPINVKAQFGEKAVLLNSSGQRVPVDQQGFILNELEHLGVYHLVYV